MCDRKLIPMEISGGIITINDEKGSKNAKRH